MLHHGARMIPEQTVTPTCIPIYKILANRELGFKAKNGFGDKLTKKIYTSLDVHLDDVGQQAFIPSSPGSLGGIFNLEFSLDGRTLAAAYEKQSIMLYDAANQKPYTLISSAHDNCVNCIKYLSDWIFASCSDDHSVRIWDVRNLNQPIRVLNGHTNWVKNIDYLEDEQILISSAFDGAIIAWDLNGYTENGLIYVNLYVMNDLMRTKITNDGTKMVLTSANGYMMIIHDLNWQTLSKDLGLFKPNLYRYLQQQQHEGGNDASSSTMMFSFLFNQGRKRNRVELIDDFPNQPKIISSLQLHPMGWCAVSRNVNGQENQEWTAVHDIQTRPSSDYNDANIIIENISDDTYFDENSMNYDRWLNLLSQINQNLFRPTQPIETVDFDNELFGPSMLLDSEDQERSKYRNHIFFNVPRLTHYVQEKTAGSGFIKEQCFSRDGRVICSPYDSGLRLLAFNDQLQELSDCITHYPKKLYTAMEVNDYHQNCVVSCKFSPVHNQLVSGCLDGELIWYTPLF